MLDKDGNPLPATVEQAEKLRQYINEEWSPKSNGRIRELKNALDEDVASMAGEDIYKKARALHAMKEASSPTRRASRPSSIRRASTGRCPSRRSATRSRACRTRSSSTS
jgi:hypothetical protein